MKKWIKIPLRLLGFIVFYIVPIVIVFEYHIIVESGYNLDLFGILIMILLLIYFNGKLNKQIDVWKIQDKYARLREFINGMRVILISGGSWILWIKLNSQYEKIENTLALLTICFTIGFILLFITAKKKEE